MKATQFLNFFNDYLDTPSIFGFYGTITSLTDIKVYFRQNIMTETSILSN